MIVGTVVLVSMSEWFRDRPVRPGEHPLPPDRVTHYRGMLRRHATEPGLGLCRICGVERCVNWRDAFDYLAAAGVLMVEPELWERASSPTSGGDPPRWQHDQEITWPAV